MKRFYTKVAAVAGDGGWSVTLDGRPVKTPSSAPLVLPNAALAAEVAAEWDAQTEKLDPSTMPMTGFAYAAIDRIAADSAGFAAGLARFAETELLCYRAETPGPLVSRQAAGWDPLLSWAAARYDVVFTVTTGIRHVAQPAATLARIRAAYVAFDPFRLAALNPVVTICGSAIIGLALAEGRIDAEAAFSAGQLDELWQAEQWGSDPLAVASLENRRAAVDTAHRLLTIL